MFLTFKVIKKLGHFLENKDIYSSSLGENMTFILPKFMCSYTHINFDLKILNFRLFINQIIVPRKKNSNNEDNETY